MRTHVENIPSPEENPLLFPSIEDISEAEEFIEQLFEKGDRPIVTVPTQYAEAIKEGLQARTSWIPDLKVIAATFGRDPFLPEDEERVTVRVNINNHEYIKPRFTGPDKKFHGVVTIEGPIPSENIEVL